MSSIEDNHFKVIKLDRSMLDEVVHLHSIVFDEKTDNIKGTLTSLMWSNCKACHSKFREEH